MGRQRQDGVTLIEMVVIVGIIGLMAAMAVPSLTRFQRDQRVKETARNIAGAIHQARTEAIRLGFNHVVFIGEDTTTSPIAGIAVLADADEDCLVDPGEDFTVFRLEQGVNLGAAVSGGIAPGDAGGAPVNRPNGMTFSQASPQPPGTPAQWVLFRPDGIPIALDPSCSLGTLGTGGGGVYVTNNARDYAVVVTPLGGVHIRGFEVGNGVWQ